MLESISLEGLTAQNSANQRRKGLTTREKACMKRYAYISPTDSAVRKMVEEALSPTPTNHPRRRRAGISEAHFGADEKECSFLEAAEKQYGAIVERLLPLPVRQSNSRQGSRGGSRKARFGRRAAAQTGETIAGMVGAAALAAVAAQKMMPTSPAERNAAAAAAAAAAAPEVPDFGTRLVKRHYKWDAEGNELTQNVIRLVLGASANKIERDVGGKIKFIHSKSSSSPDLDAEQALGDPTPISKSYTVARGGQELQGHPLHQFRARMFKAYPSALAAFDALNVDGNRSLDMREWCEITATWGLCSLFEARVIFELMDANRDGTLTLHEFQMGLEAVRPVLSLAAARKRLVCLGFETMLHAIAVMDGGGEDTTHVPLTFQEFGCALRRAYILEDREHRALFNLVRDPTDPSCKASLSDLAAGLSGVSPCMIMCEAGMQLDQKYGSRAKAFEQLEDAWLESPTAWETYGSKWLGMSKIEALKIFRFTDIDRSGSLTREELEGVLELSVASIDREDIRVKVNQCYRGIETTLRNGVTQPGDDLDDELRFGTQELKELLEPVCRMMGRVETYKLIDLVLAITHEDGVTLSEFFRAVRLFAPSCCMDGLRLQLLARYGRISDAFVGVANKRRPMSETELYELLTSLGVQLDDFSVCFDLIDVRSSGRATLTEFMAALQGAQTGTRRCLNSRERQESIKKIVGEEFAGVKGSLTDLKQGIRRGLAAPSRGASQAGRRGGQDNNNNSNANDALSPKRQSLSGLLCSPKGGPMGPSARKKSISRAANRLSITSPRSGDADPDGNDSPERGSESVKGGRGGNNNNSNNHNNNKNSNGNAMHKSPTVHGKRRGDPNFGRRESIGLQEAEIKSPGTMSDEFQEKCLAAVKDYYTTQEKAIGDQQLILKLGYTKAKLHSDLNELRSFDRPAALRRAGLSTLSSSSSAPTLR